MFVRQQQQLLLDCLSDFNSETNSEKQRKIVSALCSLFPAQNYSANEISEIMKMHAGTINRILLLIHFEPQAKSVFANFRESLQFLSAEVIISYCGNELENWSESQQMELLSKVLPDLEDFNRYSNMMAYLLALETLLGTFLKTQNNHENVKEKIARFAMNNKKQFNQALLRDKGASIFSRGALLSLVPFKALDIATKHKYMGLLGLGNNQRFLWHLFGEYLEQFARDKYYQPEMCDILRKLEAKEPYIAEFVENYKELFNSRHLRPFPAYSSVPKFFLTIPDLLDVEAKYRFSYAMDTSQMYDWLEECLTKYETLPITNGVLRMLDKVCALIGEGINEERIRTMKERHTHLIVDKINPKNKGNFIHLQEIFDESTVSLRKKLVRIQKVLKSSNWFFGSNKCCKLNVDRSNILESSYNMTSGLTVDEWRSNKFVVTFDNEAGIDAGGLLREWFTVTTRAILNPNFGLFVPVPGDVNSYIINKSSHFDSDHLKYFKFIGRFLAKGVLENIRLDCPLTKVLYKHIVDVAVEYSDFKNQDPEFFNSLDFLLNNPISESGLDLTFSIEIDEYGKLTEKSLVDNGENIQVTDENKHEYVKLVSEMKMTESIRPQLEAFLAGFHDVIPKRLVTRFDEKELEQLLCGQSEIDINDLKANTKYSVYRESDDVIQWFWRALASFDKDDKARFLMFTTGSPKPPLHGFSMLQGSVDSREFNIWSDMRDGDRLPTAHTCFNRLDLPRYTSYETLREKLLLAIREGTEGFGMV